MARWIGGSTLDRAKCNIQGYVNCKDADAIARYIDILRQEYATEANGAERAMLASAGKIAQAAYVRLAGKAHGKGGWTERAKAIYAASCA